MSDAATPPGGGNTKFVVAGVLLLLGAVALFLMLQSSPESGPELAKPVAAPAVEQVQRVNPMAEQDLLLDEIEEEPDAGAPEPEAEKPKKSSRRAARPKRDAWDCDGDLDRAGLQKVIARNRAQVRTCYERRLKINNLLQGNLKLKIKVGAGGKVAAMATSGSLRDKEVYSCVRKLAKDWAFPAPSGGACAVVRVPFQFSPKN